MNHSKVLIITSSYPGHSYLPCDRDFGIIEKKLKVVEVFTQDNYIELLKLSKIRNPFKVVKMEITDFLDFGVMQNVISKRTLQNVSFKDGRVFSFSNEYKLGYATKPNYNVTEPEKVQLQKGRSKQYNAEILDRSKIVLPVKYGSHVHLSAEKLADIKSALTYVPVHHKEFFNNIIAMHDCEEVHLENDDVGDEDHPDF